MRNNFDGLIPKRRMGRFSSSLSFVRDDQQFSACAHDICYFCHPRRLDDSEEMVLESISTVHLLNITLTTDDLCDDIARVVAAMSRRLPPRCLHSGSNESTPCLFCEILRSYHERPHTTLCIGGKILKLRGFFFVEPAPSDGPQEGLNVWYGWSSGCKPPKVLSN